MRRIEAIILSFLLCGLSARSQILPEHIEKGTLEGRVTDAAGHASLAGVEVLVYKDTSPQAPLLVLTDSNGHFKAEDLDPGLYGVMAQRTNYVSAHYGERARNRQGLKLSVAGGQKLTGIDIHLQHCGLITGHVLGDGNELQVRTAVAALSTHYLNGLQRLDIETVAFTNDLGEYRLFGLRPGRYYIAAFPPNRLRSVRLPKDAPPEERYGISFYPDSADTSKAPTVNVGLGGELHSAEIHLVRRRTYHVRGRISGADRGVQDAHVQIEPLLLGTLLNVGGQQATPDASGAFDFGGILPGEYLVSASFASHGGHYQAQSHVEVDDSDTANVFLQSSAGILLQGSVHFSERKEEDLHSVNLTFRPAYSSGAGGPAVRSTPQGSLTASLSAETYIVEFAGLPGDSYVESMRFLDVEATDRVLDLSRFTSSWARLDVTLNPNGGHIEGKAENADHSPVAGATVLLVPDLDGHKQPFLFRSVITDSHGAFEISGIVPGHYTVLAWEDVEPGAWYDLEFLSTYESSGERIDLQPNGRLSRMIKVIPVS